MAAQVAPIIIKRKKAAHAAHHGGAWKVAYADFVTAMMALFIVLWLMNTGEKVQNAVGGYFRDPAGVGKQAGTAENGNGRSLALTKDDMAGLKEKIEAAFKSIPDFREKLSKQVQMTISNEGLRIEFLETDAGLFFESGSATPTVSGARMLSSLAQEIGGIPNRLLIEGHTDSHPFSGGNHYSNWELSADRANSARKLMQSSGLRSGQVSQVRGFADQNLRDPSKPQSAANRRISVVVQYEPAPAGEAAAPSDARHSPTSAHAGGHAK